MVGFINKDSLKLQPVQQVYRFCHSYETLRTKVDLVVVPGAHFAETRKVGSKLVQQGPERHDDQHLSMFNTTKTTMVQWKIHHNMPKLLSTSHEKTRNPSGDVPDELLDDPCLARAARHLNNPRTLGTSLQAVSLAGSQGRIIVIVGFHRQRTALAQPGG